MLHRSKKSQQVLGIHVSRSALTLARVLRHPDALEITQLFHEPLPRDPGTWPADRVGAVLRLAKRSVNMNAEQAHITLASDLAPNHFFTMPAMKPDQMANAVKLQLENKWGSAGSELCFEFKAFEKRGERCRVFAPSIPLETLHQILASFLAVKCRIDLLEVEAVSVTNLLVHCDLVSSAPVAVLDVGPEASEIHIVRRKRVVLSRSIAKPENEAIKIDDDPVAPRKEESVGTPVEGVGLDPNYAGRLSREANKTLDYFEIELLAPPVERMLLIGEASGSPALVSYLGQELDLTVRPVGAGNRIQDRTGQFEPALHAVAAAAAAGERQGASDEN